jgi:hypothetical protein
VFQRPADDFSGILNHPDYVERRIKELADTLQNEGMIID